MMAQAGQGHCSTMPCTVLCIDSMEFQCAWTVAGPAGVTVTGMVTLSSMLPSYHTGES